MKSFLHSSAPKNQTANAEPGRVNLALKPAGKNKPNSSYTTRAFVSGHSARQLHLGTLRYLCGTFFLGKHYSLVTNCVDLYQVGCMAGITVQNTDELWGEDNAGMPGMRSKRAILRWSSNLGHWGVGRKTIRRHLGSRFGECCRLVALGSEVGGFQLGRLVAVWNRSLRAARRVSLPVGRLQPQLLATLVRGASRLHEVLRYRA